VHEMQFQISNSTGSRRQCAEHTCLHTCTHTTSEQALSSSVTETLPQYQIQHLRAGIFAGVKALKFKALSHSRRPLPPYAPLALDEQAYSTVW
jgi:hypothetical protein